MNKALKTLYIYNGIFTFASQLLGPLYAIYVSKVVPDILAVSLSWSVFLISSVFFTYVISIIGDRFKEKELFLIAGFVVRALVWVGYIFVGSLPLLLLLQLLLGFGDALGTPAFDAIFAEHLDEGKHIAEYARWKIISNLAGAVSVFIGGLIVEFFGFNLLFGIMAALAIVAAIGLFLKPRELL